MIAYCVAASLAVFATANFLIWRRWNQLHVPLPIPVRYGRPAACLLTLTVVLFPWYWTASISRAHDERMDNLRASHPFVSMEERLPTPRVTASAHDDRVEAYEAYLEGDMQFNDYSQDFAKLHAEKVRTFSMMPGVGQMRMRSHIAKAEILPEPIPQSSGPQSDIDPTGDAWPDAKVRDFFGLHATSIGSFVNFKGFGYLKSRREVAGFTPHAFQHLPVPKPRYTLERLELVGLVRNPEPSVYVSEFLPRMTELDTTATRPVDGFEATGLKRLSEGEDLVANAVGSKVRLLGAVRNMTACVECHGGQRGDLLGAFSYRLAETK